MTTILQVIQTAAKRCGINYAVTSVIGSTDNNIIQLLTKCEEAGKAIRDFADWPELQKEHTFTLTTSVDSYVLPADFNRMIDGTQWNRDQTWPLYGPIPADYWQYLKSGVVSLQVNQRFRVKGWADKQFFIDATPDSSFSGDTLVYEYVTKTWIRPKTWVASTSWNTIQYCSYNGNIYNRGATTALSTGTSAPVHTTGAISDGSITWTYLSTAYETFMHDTDEVILDDEDVIQGTVWRWKMENGYAYEPYAAEAMTRLLNSKADLNGASIMDFKRSNSPFLLSTRGFPEGSYG